MFKLPTLAAEESEVSLLVLVVMLAMAAPDGLNESVPANEARLPMRRPIC